jgi:predicted enzyme related to lactoylglutathione lyase
MAVRIRGYADGTPCWARLRTVDPATAAAFYGGLFEWRLSGDLFRRGDAVVAGLIPAPESAPAWLTYLAADDLGALCHRVADSGGAVVAAPSAVGAYGHGALLRDPGGGEFGAWQRGTLAGAQLGSEPDTVCWSELATGDEHGAELFYGKLFGWVAQTGVLAPERGFREWQVNGRVVAGLVPEAGAPPQWRTTVEVLDAVETVQRCLDLGGRVAHGPVDLMVGRYIRLADPLGATFGIIELIPELRGVGAG